MTCQRPTIVSHHIGIPVTLIALFHDAWDGVTETSRIELSRAGAGSGKSEKYSAPPRPPPCACRLSANFIFGRADDGPRPYAKGYGYSRIGAARPIGIEVTF
ncbi:hypothetical protein EVAR_83602_1 [Eumeta japonica]|uniref:Uncharacterized protein n=1 Tax=Eumeta variegata TaxID=151549 RepID=A0A4C1UNF3_EUMVA|nr:hypothetical protein EVAR_83602_1 [Eumeta japonica]